jgi:hypothetical protein
LPRLTFSTLPTPRFPVAALGMLTDLTWEAS